MDLRPHRGDARARLQGHGRRSSRAVCRGRTSRCCSDRSPRTLARSSRRCGAADIPYVVKGLNRLFDSPEIQAVVGIFRYMAGLIDGRGPAHALGRREPCSRPTATGPRRSTVLDEGRDFDRGERWGVYNIQRLYLEFLEALGLREETVPGDAGAPRAGLLPARQVQPGDLGLRADLLQHRAASRSTRRSRTGSSTRRPATTPSLTPTSATRRPTRSRSRPCTRPRGCSGRRCSCPCLRNEPVPGEAAGRARPLPRHPGRRDRRRRPLPRHASRTRRGCSTSR